MNELLQNPAIHGGIVPFLVGLAVAASLSRTRLLGLSQLAGFIALAGIAVGLSFESLTATKKLVLVGMASGAAVLAIEWRPTPVSRAQRAALMAVIAGASAWVLWRLLAQLEPGFAWLAGLLAAVYVCLLADSTIRIGADPVAGAATGLMLGLGTGMVAVLGASALLGLIAISVGAASGAALLVQMIRGRSPAGTTIGLPAAVICGLAGALAVLSASGLPWFCLLPLLATPWASRLASRRLQPTWQSAVVASLACLVPALCAVALAWFTAGTGVR